ncbi:MAG: YfbK domain-containing protein [Sphingobium sp.]
MEAEQYGPEFTAFALGDPGLTAAQKVAVEARIAADPEARAAVEETAALGQHLSQQLAMEPAVVSPRGETVVASAAKRRALRQSVAWAATIAAMVLFCVGVLVNSGKGVDVVQTGRPARGEDGVLDEDLTVEAAIVKNDQPAGPGEGRNKSSGYPDVDKAISGNPRPSIGGPVPKAQKEVAEGLPHQASKGPPQEPAKPVRPLMEPYPETPKITAPLTLTGTATINMPPSGGTVAVAPGGIPVAAGESKLPASSPRDRIELNGNLRGEQKPSPNDTERHLKLLLEQRQTKMSTGMGRDHPDIRVLDAEIQFYEGEQRKRQETNPLGDRFSKTIENPFTETKGQAALSTFGVDVDTASYSILRKMITENRLPPADAVRIEELINYFPYKDAPPEGNDPFAVRVEMGECPWQPKHRLARIALKAKAIDKDKRPPTNLVFLIDVSGSMDAPNRLPLVKAAMKLLTAQLGENDRVAIVTYAGESKLNLESTNASQKETINRALDELKAGGSTHGSDGIQRAYDTAQKHFIEKGVNRVVLCTDGDWNVGTTSTEALLELIEAKRKTGVFLSVFGFGMGNLRDEMMVKLAGKGNGNYAYIDGIAEAKKALVEQLSGTLVTVAKDAKLQIEFNPARIAQYRLIGYEKRILAAQDFHDDKKDSGEMGAGHTVTALYELVPVEAVVQKGEGLRYQPSPEPAKPAADDKAKEAFVLKLRHKQPDKDESVLREIPVGDVAKSFDKPTQDFQFAASVAAFGMLLRDSQYKGSANYALVEELAGASMTEDPGAYRAEFLQLVKKARALAGK